MVHRSRAAARLVAFCALWLLPVPPTAAEVELFELHHRDAAEILPLLRPLAGPDATLSGNDRQLVVRAPAADMTAIADAIAQLDAAQPALLVSVRQGGAATRYGRGITVFSTRAEDRIEQQVRTSAGHWTRIDAGSEFPVVSLQASQTAFGGTQQYAVEYKPVGSGFEALVRLDGDRAVIDLRQHYGRLSPRGGGLVDTQTASTRVSGPLGEWLAVVSHDEGAGAEHTTIARTYDSDTSTRNVYVKVERLP